MKDILTLSWSLTRLAGQACPSTGCMLHAGAGSAKIRVEKAIITIDLAFCISFSGSLDIESALQSVYNVMEARKPGSLETSS